MAKVYVVVPACSWPDPADPGGDAHPHLAAMLESCLLAAEPAAGSQDPAVALEVWVGIDGVRPRVLDVVREFRERVWKDEARCDRTLVVPIEHGFRGEWGNPQRNRILDAISQYRPVEHSEFVHCNDQDDSYVPGALARACALADEVAGVGRLRPRPRPLMLKANIWQNGGADVLDPPDRIWKREGWVEEGSVGGHCLFAPLVPELLGRFSPEDAYAADFGYVRETLRRFDEAGLPAHWSDLTLCEARPWAIDDELRKRVGRCAR